MDDFVAIDFETANRHRDSACAIGVAVVQAGKITDTFSSLIRPPGMSFDKDLIRIHGITPQAVRDAPIFPDIWPEVARRCRSGIIVAHNAAFDVGVIKASTAKARLNWLPEHYLCTVQVARSILPGLPNHKLHTLTTLFGISLDHHDAASDAIACAELATRLFRLAGPNMTATHCRCCDDFGHSAQNPVESRAASDYRLSKTFDAQSTVGDQSMPLVDLADADGRFDGQCFVFTGELTFMERSDARVIVEHQGGRSVGSVSKKTDVVVVGDEVFDDYKRSGKTTGKLAKAVALEETGLPIRIINESEFVAMIGPR